MYTYDAIHNTIIHVEDDDDRVIQDGEHLRVRMTAMDYTQLAIAGSVTKIDDGDVKRVSRQEMADWDKAQLSSRWKGGLQDGDRVRIGDRDLVVSGRNPTTGKIQLRDASTSTSDAEARHNMYDEYDNDIQSRYLTTYDAKAGETCMTAGREQGTWRERAKDGRLVCVPSKSAKEQEWDIAGPLSDTQRVKVKDEMYSDYDAQIQNAWRK